MEGSKLLGINFNTIKSLKINQNFKAIVFSATDSSKSFTTLFEGTYNKNDLLNQNINKIEKIVISGIDEDIKKNVVV